MLSETLSRCFCRSLLEIRHHRFLSIAENCASPLESGQTLSLGLRPFSEAERQPPCSTGTTTHTIPLGPLNFGGQGCRTDASGRSTGPGEGSGGGRLGRMCQMVQ